MSRHTRRSTHPGMGCRIIALPAVEELGLVSVRSPRSRPLRPLQTPSQAPCACICSCIGNRRLGRCFAWSWSSRHRTDTAGEPPRAGRDRTVAFHASSLTCAVDGLAHLVSDDAAAAGVVARQGTYTALCGHTVHAAALASSLGRPCQLCDEQAQAGHEPDGVETRRRRRGRGAGRREERKAIR